MVIIIIIIPRMASEEAEGAEGGWQRGYRIVETTTWLACIQTCPASLQRRQRGHGPTNVALSPRPADGVKPLASPLSFGKSILWRRRDCSDANSRRKALSRPVAGASHTGAGASHTRAGRQEAPTHTRKGHGRNDAALPTQCRPMRLACRALSPSGAPAHPHHRAGHNTTTTRIHARGGKNIVHETHAEQCA